MSIMQLLKHRLSRQPATPQNTGDHHSHCFKGKGSQGPFLLSCDGRVIPLRKAYFLRDHTK
jgi:hypothetical protein